MRNKGTTLKVIAKYNPKQNNITISSKDAKLRGKSFMITLTRGSETEQTLRELLITEGVMRLDDLRDATALIPKLALTPAIPNTNDPLLIPFGVGESGIGEVINFKPHVTTNFLSVYGRTGSGKTCFLASVLNHTRRHNIRTLYKSSFDSGAELLSFLPEIPGVSSMDDLKNVTRLDSPKEGLTIDRLIEALDDGNQEPTFIIIDGPTEITPQGWNELNRMARSKNWYFIVTSQSKSDMMFLKNHHRLHMGTYIDEVSEMQHQFFISRPGLAALVENQSDKVKFVQTYYTPSHKV